ncbi:hypothetical protein BDN67DRAFT_984784 [Paxillus ammoniavirescens]|nr:hypothetical protein BDN67DRAFT_984784 [Paxillus ammoniavirescens]
MFPDQPVYIVTCPQLRFMIDYSLKIHTVPAHKRPLCPLSYQQVAQAYNKNGGDEIGLFTEIDAILFGDEHGAVEAQEAETDVKLHQDAVRKHLRGNQKMAERFAARDKQRASVMEHVAFPTISREASNSSKEGVGEGSAVGGAEVEMEMRDKPAFNINMDKEIDGSLAAAGIHI